MIEENLIHHSGREGGAAINLDGVVGATITLTCSTRTAPAACIFRIGSAARLSNLVINNVVMPADPLGGPRLGREHRHDDRQQHPPPDHDTRGAIDLSRAAAAWSATQHRDRPVPLDDAER
jgi:hypothetical protein